MKRMQLGRHKGMSPLISSEESKVEPWDEGWVKEKITELVETGKNPGDCSGSTSSLES